MCVCSINRPSIFHFVLTVAGRSLVRTSAMTYMQHLSDSCKFNEFYRGRSKGGRGGGYHNALRFEVHIKVYKFAQAACIRRALNDRTSA